MVADAQEVLQLQYLPMLQATCITTKMMTESIPELFGVWWPVVDVFVAHWDSIIFPQASSCSRFECQRHQAAKQKVEKDLMAQIQSYAKDHKGVLFDWSVLLKTS